MSEFDWVQARSECSLAVIFEQLKSHLKYDVEKAQALRPHSQGLPCHYGFSLALTDRAATVIVQGSNNIYGLVSFRLTDSAIEVVDKNDKVRCTATPTLNSNGECRLKINGEEHELWYLRKLALEEMFFRDYFI